MNFLKLLQCSLMRISHRSKHCAPELDLDECFEFACGLTRQASAIITKATNRPRVYSSKENNAQDLVTETDTKVEKYLKHRILKRYPDHKFIGEEQSAADCKGAKLTKTPTWVIDPIDGTLNFIHGFPFSCISIAVVVNKVTEIAIVLNPFLEQLYTARSCQGAFMNGRRIRVSGEKDLRKALIITEFHSSLNTKRRIKAQLNNVSRLYKHVHALRTMGSCAMDLCMIARGAGDCYYEFGPHAWDMCAGELIVREAGGVALDPTGKKLDIMARRVLAASSIEVASAVIKNLNQIYPNPRDDGQNQ